MAFSEDPVIEDLVLTIINDGEGTQCGMNYCARCQAAENGIFEYRLAVRNYNRYRRSVYGSPHASREQVLMAATLIQKYYREHVKEK